MAPRQKPQEDLVKVAGRAMTHPESLTGSEIKRMATRILDDQRNEPEANKTKPSLAAQVIAKVSDIFPDAVKPKAAAKSQASSIAKVPPAKATPAKPVAAKTLPAAPKPAPAKPAPEKAVAASKSKPAPKA